MFRLNQWSHWWREEPRSNRFLISSVWPTSLTPHCSTSNSGRTALPQGPFKIRGAAAVAELSVSPFQPSVGANFTTCHRSNLMDLEGNVCLVMSKKKPNNFTWWKSGTLKSGFEPMKEIYKTIWRLWSNERLRLILNKLLAQIWWRSPEPDPEAACHNQ